MIDDFEIDFYGDDRLTFYEEFSSEKEAEDCFDSHLEEDLSGCFRVFKQVNGVAFIPYQGKEDKDTRIDRILFPTDKAVDMGWSMGVVGVEIKSGYRKSGSAPCQAFDYMRSLFKVNRTNVQLNYCFVFPFKRRDGTAWSMMQHLRIGCIRGYFNNHTGRRMMTWNMGRNVVSPLDGYSFHSPVSGNRTGSR